MLNELTGLLNYSQINEYKKSVRVNEDMQHNRSKVNNVDTFIKDKHYNDLNEFNLNKQCGTLKKGLKEKPKNFEEYLKIACNALKKRK